MYLSLLQEERLVLNKKKILTHYRQEEHTLSDISSGQGHGNTGSEQ